MPHGKSKIPERWEDYSNIGEVIPGTRFIAFKVPLKEQLCRNCSNPEELWFTPQSLLDITRGNASPVGLVIDLTFTTRYYDAQEFTSQGVDYKKILVPGQVIPEDDIICSFFHTVDAFLQNPETEGQLVGVHCTHGVNRTGYIVCRYMIEKLGMDPEKAIEACGRARGYPIERENYLEDLKHRSVDTDPTKFEGRNESSTRLGDYPPNHSHQHRMPWRGRGHPNHPPVCNQQIDRQYPPYRHPHNASGRGHIRGSYGSGYNPRYPSYHRSNSNEYFGFHRQRDTGRDQSRNHQGQNGYSGYNNYNHRMDSGNRYQSRGNQTSYNGSSRNSSSDNWQQSGTENRRWTNPSWRNTQQ